MREIMRHLKITSLKIQEGRLLLHFRGGLYLESNANLYDERFIGGGINLRVGEYE